MLTNMFRDILFVYLSLCVMFSDGKVFKIAWMVPGPGSTHSINSGTSGGAMAVALSALSKNSNILRGHTIDMKMFDTKCDAQSGMIAAMTANNTYGPDVYIGPPCPNAMKSVARYANFYNIPTFGWYNPESEFDDYPTLIRMHPPMKSLAKSLLYSLTDMKQTQVSLLYEDMPPYSVLKTSVDAELQKSSIRIRYSGTYSSTMTVDAVDQLMIAVKNLKGAVVFMMSSDGVRRCILSALRTVTVTANFQYIHLDPQIYKDTELKTSVLGDGYWRRGDQSDRTVRRVYNKLTHIIVDPMNDDHDPTIQDPRSRFTDFYHLTKSVAASSYKKYGITRSGQPDVYSLYLYDCVSVWSVLADQILKDNKRVTDAKLMTLKSKTFKAEGSTGYISLDNKADRTAKVFLLGMEGAGAFRSQKILKFDKTGSYKAIVINRVVTHPGRPGGEQYPLNGHQSARGQMPSSVKLPTKPTSAVPMSHLNELRSIQGATVDAVNSANPLAVTMNRIMNRLASLEKAVTKALNHDHTRDHPPHERLQAHYHPPHTPPHTHSKPSKPAPKKTPTPNYEATKTEPGVKPGRKKNPRKAGRKGKATVDKTAETVATQLISKLSGVLNNTINSLQPGVAAPGQQEPTPPVNTKPPAQLPEAIDRQQQGGEYQGGAANSGEHPGSAMQQEFSEAMARIREEIPAEMHPFINFNGMNPFFPTFHDPHPAPPHPAPLPSKNSQAGKTKAKPNSSGIGNSRGSQSQPGPPNGAPVETPTVVNPWYEQVWWR